MMPTINRLDDLAERLERGGEFTRADADLLATSHDLVRIGMLGDAARRRLTGHDVTFGRVAVVAPGDQPVVGHAGEVRLTGTPASSDEAVSRVREVAPLVSGSVLTGYSLADLVALVGHDHLALADMARALHAAGLEAVAETPIDRFDSTEAAVEVMRAARHGGLATWRVTVDRAPMAARIDLIVRAAEVQRETGAVRAFAPLPRVDRTDAPSTGYDDVRTIAVARLLCGAIERIQVDWPLYGPKLAQVALTFGAGDVDGIAATDDPALGPRRAAAEDIARQIRAASGVPVERNGRYQVS